MNKRCYGKSDYRVYKKLYKKWLKEQKKCK